MSSPQGPVGPHVFISEHLILKPKMGGGFKEKTLKIDYPKGLPDNFLNFLKNPLRILFSAKIYKVINSRKLKGTNHFCR